MFKTKITPLALVIASLSAPASADLIISEYIEGSSNNKAIELYNNADTELSLEGYTLGLYSNGSSSIGNSIDLTGTLAANTTYIISNPSAAAAILDIADETSTVTYYNGDDALVLTKDGVIVDSFAQVGVDPGSEWSEGGVTTVNKTLRRKDSITTGRTDSTANFDPSEEWEQFDIDTFDGLGSHTGNGGTAPVPDPEPEPLEPLVCGAEKTLINAIQSDGSASPLVGTLVELVGVVSADFQGDELLKMKAAG